MPHRLSAGLSPGLEPVQLPSDVKMRSDLKLSMGLWHTINCWMMPMQPWHTPQLHWG